MKKVSIVVIALIICLLSACKGQWGTFNEGIYKGQKYEIQSREVKGFSTNRIEYRFRLGDLKYIEVGAHTTDWGPPYSTDIYGAEAFEYITGTDTAYHNVTPAPEEERTFLYFSKNRFDEQDYETYAAFMRNEWIKIDKQVHSNQITHFPHIIGLVYGSPEDFKKEFKGKYMDGDVTFTIENDGRIRLLSNGGEYGHNFSLKIQMPGKRILMDTTYKDLTLELLKTFKNKKGADPTRFFEFIPVNSIPKTNASF